MRQLQVLEEQIEELGAGQAEGELVYRFPFTRLGAAFPLPALRPVEGVALGKLAVAGVHHLAVAARAVPESRLGNITGGQVDLAPLVHVLDRAVTDHPVDRLADLVLVTPEKTLPVDGAFIAPVQTAIDQ
ncbi:hypothetical protein FQZ97_745210 [compost metagenome]